MLLLKEMMASPDMTPSNFHRPEVRDGCWYYAQDILRI